jgi:hypothetical protein
MNSSKAFTNTSVFQIDVRQSKDRRCPRITITKSNYSYNTIDGKLLFERIDYLFKDCLIDQIC